jgi:ribosomal protein S20
MLSDLNSAERAQKPDARDIPTEEETMLKKVLTAIALSAFMMGTAHAGADKAAAEKAIEEAKASLKKAASVGGEWRDSGKMVKAAEKALQEGDFDTAVKQANKAAKQGQMGHDQAITQQDVGNPDYL